MNKNGLFNSTNINDCQLVRIAILTKNVFKPEMH